MAIIIFITIIGNAAACNLCGITQTKETDTPITINNKSASTSVQDSIEETFAETTVEEITSGASIVITEGITSNENKQVALTFDAGWLYENTEELLHLLDKYNVKATFFARGLWVKEHPELAMKIINKGHKLENHSLTHGHLVEMTDEEVRNEISKTTDIISKMTGYLPNLFRPPYGEYDERMLRILKVEGYPYTILWTVDSHDWAEELNGVKITKDYLVNRVLDNASDNGIILMHVGGYETINAMHEIITGLKSQGYELVYVKDII